MVCVTFLRGVINQCTDIQTGLDTLLLVFLQMFNANTNNILICNNAKKAMKNVYMTVGTCTVAASETLILVC